MSHLPFILLHHLPYAPPLLPSLHSCPAVLIGLPVLSLSLYHSSLLCKTVSIIPYYRYKSLHVLLSLSVLKPPREKNTWKGIFSVASLVLPCLPSSCLGLHSIDISFLPLPHPPPPLPSVPLLPPPSPPDVPLPVPLPASHRASPLAISCPPPLPYVPLL